MTLSQSLAAIAWDPQIRGVLVVVVMVALLMGSVYLLLATNLANRLGFLVALTGLFGWMTLLGINWWLYGQGWTGDGPTWDVEEINTGDLDGANLEDARVLSPEGIDEALAGEGISGYEELNELEPDEFEEIADGVEDQLGGWTLLNESDPVRGEAQSAVDDALTGPAYPSFETTNDYVVLYGMDLGGKPEADQDNLLDVMGNRITNTLRPQHPTKHAVVMVQPAAPEFDTLPGEEPAPIVPTPNTETVSVVMVRNLGDLRLPAAMTTIVSGVLFGLCCYLLHVRDRTIEANRAAPLPAVPGADPALDKANGSS